MPKSRENALTRYAPRIVASTFLLLALSYLAVGRQYPLQQHDQVGPGLYPLVVGVFWVLVATVSLLAVIRDEAREVAEVRWPERGGWLRIALIVAAAALYVFLVPVLGDLVVGFIVLLVVMRTMGMTRLRWLIPIALVTAVLWHLVFVTGLSVPLPQGPLAG